MSISRMLISQFTTIPTFIRENDFWEIDIGNQEIPFIPDDLGYTLQEWLEKLGERVRIATFGIGLCWDCCTRGRWIREKEVDP